MKLLPRYSLKQILLAMVGVAVVMACLASAYRGSMVGMCLIAGVISSAIPLFSAGLVYWVAYGLRRRYGRPSIVIWISMSGLFASESAALSQQLIPVGKKGYHLTIEDNIPGTDFGYSNIRVKLEKFPLQPVKKQEIFTVVIGSQYGYAADRTIATLVIEPGESSASVDLACPRESNQFQYLSFSLKQGSDERGASPRDFYSTYIHSSKGGTQNSDSLIWITSLANQQTGSRIGIPERGLATNLNVQANGEAEAVAAKVFGKSPLFASTSKSIGNISFPLKEPNPVHPDCLPNAWIGFSTVTKIFITLDELKLLAEKNPVKLLAVESWIAAGGTLIVFDTDQSWKDGKLTKQEASEPNPVGWKAIDQIMPVLLGKARLDSLEEWSDRWMQYRPQKSIFLAETGSISTLPGDNQRQWQAVDWQSVKDRERFLMHRYVLGRVFAVGKHFENWKARDWTEFDNAVLDSGGTQEPLFESTSAVIDSHISIPGVGKPPLKAFQILMCLFVLAAGPGVYSVLKKSDQMQLFFFVVPVLAITSCLGLLGYVVLIEGFGSHGRTQTVTWVDHRIQSAVTQARSMYYHGLTPAPYRHGTNLVPLGNANNINNAQKIRSVDGGIDFSSSDIAPRVPHLFVNLASQRMEKNLRLQPIPSDPGGNDSANYQMFNSLGNQVEIAVFRTEDGWFLGKKIGDQQTVEAVKVSETEAHEQLSAIVNQLCPLNDDSLWVDDRFNSEAGIVAMLRYSQSMQVAPMSQLNRWILPGSYVAILSDFSEVNPLLQPVEFKHRLHVVVGKW